MPRRRLAVILLIVAVCGGAALAAVRVGGTAVRLAALGRGAVVEAVYATGTVEPVSWARVSPSASGRIVDILAREGDDVAVGQTLAQLDDREEAALLAELEARAAYWREEVARARTLTERGIKSREAEQKAQSEYRQVQAAMDAARQRRDDLRIKAPLDGVVLRRDGEIGEVVEKTDALFWVGQPRPLRITADVDEEDIARVRPGQLVLIKADAFPDQVVEGTVDAVTPKGDPINKTFRVRVRLPESSALLVGMTTEINIVTAERADAVLLPLEALKGGQVFVADGSTAQARPVRLGIRGRTMAEVTSGLEEGDKVILSPPAGLKDGARIRATQP